MEIICAWCGKKLENKEEIGINHFICDECLETLKKEMLETLKKEMKEKEKKEGGKELGNS